MFTTIVVGVDGRQGGRDALVLADRLRAAGTDELVAVQAYPYEYFVSRGSNADFEAVVREDVRKSLRAELEATGVDAQPAVVPDGSPARALHLAAERHRADLIVVGSSHRGRAGRVVAGDVSVSTMHGAPCPVLIAPAGYASREGSVRHVGVAYDGSAEARAALDLGREAATALGADLRILLVLQPAWPLTAYRSAYRDWSDHADEARDAAAAALDELVAELGPAASGEVLEGDPARELAYAGRDLDLLVCGSRSYGPVRRLLLGSTASRLLREAPCPVLVLPRGAHDTATTAATGAEAAQAGG
jgi:nucleotide-binding universal stress UspA family protein